MVDLADGQPGTDPPELHLSTRPHRRRTDLPAVAVRTAVHRALGLLLARGRDDGSVRADVTAADVVVFGAMIAQPLAPGWEPAARRQTALFLRGLSPGLADSPGPT